MNKTEKAKIKRKQTTRPKGEVDEEPRQEGACLCLCKGSREQHCFLELLWFLPLVLSLMRTSASVEQTEGVKTAKGKAVLGNTPRIIDIWGKGQRLQVDADAGIQIRMDSHFTDIQILGGKKSGRPKERKSSLYHIHKFMNFRLSSLLSKVPVPSSVWGPRVPAEQAQFPWQWLCLVSSYNAVFWEPCFPGVHHWRGWWTPVVQWPFSSAADLGPRGLHGHR